MSTSHFRNGEVDEETVERIVAVGSKLVRIALFLAAWELLRSHVRDKARSCSVRWGFRDYLEPQWSRATGMQRDGFLAALRRLSEIGALGDADMTEIRQIHTCRNEVSEELVELLLDPNYDFDLRHVVALRNLAFRLDLYEEDIVEARDLRQVGTIPAKPSRVALLFDLLLELAEGASAKSAH